MRNYYQLIPEKVEQNLITLEELIRPEIKGFSTDYLKEVISIVATHVRKEEGNTPLVMKYLKRLVPQGDKYLYWLMELGVIERTGYYEPGKASYRYNFTDEYFSKYVSVSLQNAELIYRLEKVRGSLKKETAKVTRVYFGQVKYLNSLTIDAGCLEYLNTNYTADTKQFNDISASAYRILNGDIFYKRDTTSGRFHSNVTNMEKGLRPYLRVKGEPLVNLDVKNSQPYLSTIILTNPSKVSWMTENPAFAMVLQTLKVSQKDDVKKYLGLVITGRLYEYLMDEFSKEGLVLTRSETKDQVLRILFARNRMPQEGTNRKARQIFKNRFPAVHRIFSKVRGHQRGDRFTSFKRFSILLQRIESYLMIDIVVKRINKELPGVIVITIHDSVMTGVLTNKVEEVRRIMTEELQNFVGFPPRIEIEEQTKEIREEREETLIYNQYGATTPVSIT